MWKARLAGCGNEQLEETFGAGRSSPTANMLSINTLLCLGLKKKMVIQTSDVPGAYLHADLDEIVIMRLPKSCTIIWLKILEIPESGSIHKERTCLRPIEEGSVWSRAIILTLV